MNLPPVCDFDLPLCVHILSLFRSIRRDFSPKGFHVSTSGLHFIIEKFFPNSNHFIKSFSICFCDPCPHIRHISYNNRQRIKKFDSRRTKVLHPAETCRKCSCCTCCKMHSLIYLSKHPLQNHYTVSTEGVHLISPGSYFQTFHGTYDQSFPESLSIRTHVSLKSHCGYPQNSCSGSPASGGPTPYHPDGWNSRR